MLKLLALFIVLPLLDLWLLSTLAGDSFMGFGFALGLVICTGLIGASLAKRQGLTAWRNFNREIGQGVLPADAMLDGVLILMAGAVLITPGHTAVTPIPCTESSALRDSEKPRTANLVAP